MCTITKTYYSCGHRAGSSVSPCGQEGCTKEFETDYFDYKCEECSPRRDSGYSTEDGVEGVGEGVEGELVLLWMC